MELKKIHNDRLTTRYIGPGQGVVTPFGLINTLVSVSFTISVNPDNLPASPVARRTFCNLNTTLRISAMVCTAYWTPAQLWNPAPLRLYDVSGRFGSMVVGLGNSLGWKKKKRVNRFHCNKLRRTTYVEVSILEAGPDTISSLYFERCEAISLRDWSINGDVTPETCELRVEA